MLERYRGPEETLALKEGLCLGLSPFTLEASATPLVASDFLFRWGCFRILAPRAASKQLIAIFLPLRQQQGGKLKGEVVVVARSQGVKAVEDMSPAAAVKH